MGLLYEKRDFGPNLSVGGRYALRVSFWLLEKIIAGRDLRVGVVVSEFNGMRDFTGRWIMVSGLPDPKMLQNLLDNRLVLDNADHPHFALAFWASQWVYFVHLLYQPRPVPPKFLGRQVRVNQCRYIIFLVGFPAQAAGFVAVVSVISDHLLVLAGDMGRSLIHEIDSKPLGDTEYPLPVGDGFEHFGAQPFTEFNHPLLVAGRPEVPPLA